MGWPFLFILMTYAWKPIHKMRRTNMMNGNTPLGKIKLLPNRCQFVRDNHELYANSQSARAHQTRDLDRNGVRWAIRIHTKIFLWQSRDFAETPKSVTIRVVSLLFLSPWKEHKKSECVRLAVSGGVARRESGDASSFDSQLTDRACSFNLRSFHGILEQNSDCSQSTIKDVYTSTRVDDYGYFRVFKANSNGELWTTVPQKAIHDAVIAICLGCSFSIANKLKMTGCLPHCE